MRRHADTVRPLRESNPGRQIQSLASYHWNKGPQEITPGIEPDSVVKAQILTIVLRR